MTIEKQEFRLNKHAGTMDETGRSDIILNLRIGFISCFTKNPHYRRWSKSGFIVIPLPISSFATSVAF